MVPFYSFSFWVPVLKPNSRKKGTLSFKGLLGTLVRCQGGHVAVGAALRLGSLERFLCQWNGKLGSGFSGFRT